MKKKFVTLFLSLCLVLTLLPLPAAAEGEDSQGAKTVEDLPAVEEIINLAQYDGREYGIVTDVKDQSTSNLCWAYSTMAASETAIRRPITFLTAVRILWVIRTERKAAKIIGNRAEILEKSFPSLLLGGGLLLPALRLKKIPMDRWITG